MSIKHRILILLGMLLLTGCYVHSAGSQFEQKTPGFQALHAALSKTFSGQKAWELVAQMEHHMWRLLGNEDYNWTIEHLAVPYLEQAGYVSRERAAESEQLVYWVEEEPMAEDEWTWQPKGATLAFKGKDGNEVGLTFDKNPYMVSIFSASSIQGGVTAQVVDVGRGRVQDFEGKKVVGRIVYIDRPSPDRKTGYDPQEEAYRRGAAGVIAYAPSPYADENEFSDSISFHYIEEELGLKGGWVLYLSKNVNTILKDAMAAGPVSLHASVQTRIYKGVKKTLFAQVRGETACEVASSAHLNEPGAGDNASGVATQLELARSLGELVRSGLLPKKRCTATFIWGEEYLAVKKYVKEHSDVRVGLSLDMVGGSSNFSVEKTADPSAVAGWARGADKREGTWVYDGEATLADMRPHFINDLTLKVFRYQGQAVGNQRWVRSDYFQGGSDHMYFAQGGVPSILAINWPDGCYHSDCDRLDRVNPDQLFNVGVSAGVLLAILMTADSTIAQAVVQIVKDAAFERLATEFKLSQALVAEGKDAEHEYLVLKAWTDWYVGALPTIKKFEVGGPSLSTITAIDQAVADVKRLGELYIAQLKAESAPAN